jgi:hypothetical protein
MSASRRATGAGGGTESDAIHRFLGGGLEVAGIEASDDEVAVMAGAHGLYSPLIEALLTAELDGIEPEPGIDVSGSPR